MARKGYILTRTDGTDITANDVELNQISIRNLDTKAEVETVLFQLEPGGLYTISGYTNFVSYRDGYIYYCDNQSRSTPFYKTEVSTGNRIQFCSISYSGNPVIVKGIALAGASFWTFWKDPTWSVRLAQEISLVDASLMTEINIGGAGFTDTTYGLGYDGVRIWTIADTTKKIQKRELSDWTLITDYDYPAGYSTANFYSCQIDSQNPTHLQLQGEMGTNGVVVVWDTATQTIVSEWSSADILRWKDQQFAVGGADISTPGTIQFLSTGPFKKGNAIFDYLLSDAESDVHNVVSVQYSVDGLPPLIDGLPNPDKVWLDATIGTGGSGNTNLPSSPTGEYLKKAWDTITDTGTGDTLGVYFRLILEEI